MGVHACVCYYAAVCVTRRRGLLMRSCRKRRRPSIVPPEESIGYLSNRCAICNMRQVSSNEITGIQMDGIEQKGWKETMRRSERSLIKKKKKKTQAKHLLMPNRADLCRRHRIYAVLFRAVICRLCWARISFFFRLPLPRDRFTFVQLKGSGGSLLRKKNVIKSIKIFWCFGGGCM